MFEQDNDPNMDMAGPPPPEQSNRTFIKTAGILAGIVLITMILLALYALVYLPRQKASQSSQQATAQAQDLLIMQALTQTMQAGMLATQAAVTTAAPTQTKAAVIPASATPELILPTQTPLLAFAAMTATYQAMNTQIAANLATPTLNATMPASGFADEVGLPGLVVMAFALLLVILLARRLRTKPAD
jgi:hypothetical protein